MPDPRLIPTIEKRLAAGDHHAIFCHGECLRFALRLHRRFGYKIRGTKEALDGANWTWSHVWVITNDGRAIDFNGVHHEPVIAAICGHGHSAVHDATPEEIEQQILKNELPANLGAKLDALADEIVDNHERFKQAKPIDPEVVAAFARDLAARLERG